MDHFFDFTIFAAGGQKYCRFLQLFYIDFSNESYPHLMGTSYPQMAVWIESDTDMHRTVFVKEGAGQNRWVFAGRRPESSPVFNFPWCRAEHRRRGQAGAVTG